MTDMTRPTALNTFRDSGSGSPGQDLFEPVVESIRRLSRGTEKDFLAIGRDLQDIREKSGFITSNALSASTVMAGDEIKGAISGMGSMIQELVKLFEKTDAQAGRNLDSLCSIGQTLESVKDELERLKATSRDLKMLSLSTKIQSTKTGRNSPAFMQLGYDISEMAQIISSRSVDLLKHTTDLSVKVGQVHESLRNLRLRQQDQTSKVLRGAHKIIEALSALSRMAGEEMLHIKNSSDAITGSLDQIVVSVQYQDITRQSFDRIIVELEGVKDDSHTISNSSSVTASADTGFSRDLTMVGICIQQSKNVVRVGDSIRSAIDTMMDGLDTVSRSTRKMASVSVRVSSESSHFLKELEAGISSVTSFLSAVVESGKEMSRAINAITTAVDNMSRFAGDIEMISSEVELIALNARVLAAQKGTAGAGMSVIAQAVQNTANESEKQRQSLQKLLVSVSKSSIELRKKLETAASGEEMKLDGLVRELGVFLDALRIMQSKIVQTLDGIDGLSRELYQKISCITEDIVTHERIREEVSLISLGVEMKSRSLCERITAEEFYRLTGGLYTIEELDRLKSSVRLDLVREYFPETLLIEPVPEETGTGKEAILF